jgi:hypothetical protein
MWCPGNRSANGAPCLCLAVTHNEGKLMWTTKFNDRSRHCRRRGMHVSRRTDGIWWHVAYDLSISYGSLQLMLCVFQCWGNQSCLSGLPGTRTHVQLWRVALRDASEWNVLVFWRRKNAPRWQCTRSHRLWTCFKISVGKHSIISLTVRISHPEFRICFPLGRAQVRASLPAKKASACSNHVPDMLRDKCPTIKRTMFKYWTSVASCRFSL